MEEAISFSLIILPFHLIAATLEAIWSSHWVQVFDNRPFAAWDTARRSIQGTEILQEGSVFRTVGKLFQFYSNFLSLASALSLITTWANNKPKALRFKKNLID